MPRVAVTVDVAPERGDAVDVAAAVGVDQPARPRPRDDRRMLAGPALHLGERMPDVASVALGQHGAIVESGQVGTVRPPCAERAAPRALAANRRRAGPRARHAARRGPARASKRGPRRGRRSSRGSSAPSRPAPRARVSGRPRDVEPGAGGLEREQRVVDRAERPAAPRSTSGSPRSTAKSRTR